MPRLMPSPTIEPAACSNLYNYRMRKPTPSATQPGVPAGCFAQDHNY
jgi:hypothetical protein